HRRPAGRGRHPHRPSAAAARGTADCRLRHRARSGAAGGGCRARGQHAGGGAGGGRGRGPRRAPLPRRCAGVAEDAAGRAGAVGGSRGAGARGRHELPPAVGTAGGSRAGAAPGAAGEPEPRPAGAAARRRARLQHRQRARAACAGDGGRDERRGAGAGADAAQPGAERRLAADGGTRPAGARARHAYGRRAARGRGGCRPAGAGGGAAVRRTGRLRLPSGARRGRYLSLPAGAGEAAGAGRHGVAGDRPVACRPDRGAGRRRAVVAAGHQQLLGGRRRARLAPMLAAIVRASLANPRIVTALSVLVALLGVSALLSARLDVFPDFAPPHVLVQAEAPGLDATQVEAMVTRPLEDLLAGAENVEVVRSTSSQGLAAIQVVFGRDSDPYLQRQVISERLADSATLLPPGVGAPLLSPLSSSMEYLVHFGFTSDTLSPLELRDLVRWTVKPQILGVPGVAQAQIFGGDARERQVWVDPVRLDAAGFSLDDVEAATRRGTQMSGGGYLETATQRLVLQAQAPGGSSAALAQAVVGEHNGTPVRIGDVAEVRDGAAPRFGDAIIGGKPGILVETSTQYGANTLDVTRALEQRLQKLAPELARRGVQYHPALLRPASFIESASAKLRNSLLVGAALVIVLLLVTLRDWRGALISFSAIPVSLLATVWLLGLGGLSLNTMSLGGLVVALGVVVDDAVIDVENITRRRRGAGAGSAIANLLLAASLEVRRPVFYATAAVAVAFLPILMLSGLQGAFFRPLATAFLLAVGLSLLVAMSATPALCALLMQGYQPRDEPAWLRRAKGWQHQAIEHLTGHARSVLAGVLLSGVAGLALLPLLGARLLPDFRENYL